MPMWTARTFAPSCCAFSIARCTTWLPRGTSIALSRRCSASSRARRSPITCRPTKKCAPSHSPPAAAPATPGEHGAAGNGQPAAAPELHFTELHEVRTINRSLAALARFFEEQKIGLEFNLDMLIRQERTGSDQPRYVLR